VALSAPEREGKPINRGLYNCSSRLVYLGLFLARSKVAWPHMDAFFFATGGDSGVVVRILLLHGGSGDLFFGQLVRSVLVLSICVRMGSTFLWFIRSYGGEGGVLYRASFFDMVNVGGAGFCFTCRGRSGSADIGSLFSIRRRGDSVTLAFAALSKVWSYASTTACGFRSGRASSHRAASFGSGFFSPCCQQRPMKRSSGGPLRACLHISVFFRGLLVIWVCNVLLSAI
jgi:hypothetical protein